MRVRVSIDIDYDESSLSGVDIRTHLLDAISFHIGNGMLTGDSLAVVDDCKVELEGGSSLAGASGIKLAEADPGTHCPKCKRRHTQQCIDFGRCLGCGAMLCGIIASSNV